MRYQNITNDVRIGEDAIVGAESVADLVAPHEKIREQLNAVSTEVVSTRRFVGGTNKLNPTISITNPLAKHEVGRPDLEEGLKWNFR